MSANPTIVLVHGFRGDSAHPSKVIVGRFREGHAHRRAVGLPPTSLATDGQSVASSPGASGDLLASLPKQRS